MGFPSQAYQNAPPLDHPNKLRLTILWTLSIFLIAFLVQGIVGVCLFGDAGVRSFVGGVNLFRIVVCAFGIIGAACCNRFWMILHIILAFLSLGCYLIPGWVLFWLDMFLILTFSWWGALTGAITCLEFILFVGTIAMIVVGIIFTVRLSSVKAWQNATIPPVELTPYPYVVAV